MKVIKVAKTVRVPNFGKLFTGSVIIQPIIGKELSKNIVIAKVTFGPGVRNKFHSHSSEQILIVTKGKGIVATEKEQKSCCRRRCNLYTRWRKTLAWSGRGL